MKTASACLKDAAIGRKPMIIATYAGAGILLAITRWLFQHGAMSARTQTIAALWSEARALPLCSV